MTTKPSAQFDFKTAELAISSSLANNYQQFIDDVREDLKEGFTTDFVDLQFLEQLFDIIHDESFDQFSWANFHWSLKLNDLIYLIQLHEEIMNQEEFNETNENFSDVEQELFDFWNEGIFSEVFNKNLQEGLSLIDSSDAIIPLLENEIISFYVLHINNYQQEFAEPVIYTANEDFGDKANEIILPFKNQSIRFEKNIETFPSVIIFEFNPEEKEVLLEDNLIGLISSLHNAKSKSKLNTAEDFLLHFGLFNPSLNSSSSLESLINNFLNVFELVINNYSVTSQDKEIYLEIVLTFFRTKLSLQTTKSEDQKRYKDLTLAIKNDKCLDKSVKNFLLAIVRTF